MTRFINRAVMRELMMFSRASSVPDIASLGLRVICITTCVAFWVRAHQVMRIGSSLPYVLVWLSMPWTAFHLRTECHRHIVSMTLSDVLSNAPEQARPDQVSGAGVLDDLDQAHLTQAGSRRWLIQMKAVRGSTCRCRHRQ